MNAGLFEAGVEQRRLPFEAGRRVTLPPARSSWVEGGRVHVRQHYEYSFDTGWPWRAAPYPLHDPTVWTVESASEAGTYDLPCHAGVTYSVTP